MIHLGDPVGLHQILRAHHPRLDDAEIRLQDRLLVLELRVELELITERRAPCRHVAAGGDVNLVEHVVVEVVLVWADARLLEGVDAERRDQLLAGRFLLDEGIHVGRVGRVVQRDERRIHVTGGAGRRRCGQNESRCSGKRQ